MSEWRPEVVTVGAIERHPNADRLGVTKVYDYPVIVRLGELEPGQRAVYLPVDTIVPADDPRWGFLDGHTRIRARKLRGVFSMGLLLPAPDEIHVGSSSEDVIRALRLSKHEPPAEGERGGEAEPDPGFAPRYTEIEGLRRYPDVLVEGEEVIVTEKIHGQNMRFVHHDGRLWVGSMKEWKRQAPTHWWETAKQYGLEERLCGLPDVVIFGEQFGWVQDLRYGAQPGERRLAVFDVYSLAEARYLDYDDATAIVARLGLTPVPLLCRGPWGSTVLPLQNGASTLCPQHVREGFVVRPCKERWDDRCGRVVLKMVGEDYHTRKGG